MEYVHSKCVSIPKHLQSSVLSFSVLIIDMHRLVQYFLTFPVKRRDFVVGFHQRTPGKVVEVFRMDGKWQGAATVDVTISSTY